MILYNADVDFHTAHCAHQQSILISCFPRATSEGNDLWGWESEIRGQMMEGTLRQKPILHNHVSSLPIKLILFQPGFHFDWITCSLCFSGFDFLGRHTWQAAMSKDIGPKYSTVQASWASPHFFTFCFQRNRFFFSQRELEKFILIYFTECMQNTKDKAV